MIRVQAAAGRRRVVQGHRVEFLDFEIAHLEAYEFLGPGKGEVLVDAHCSLVSPGTERAVLCGLPGARRSFPYVPGYSTAGIVEQLGPGVTALKTGDRVTGRVHHADRETIGANRMFKIPKGVSFEDASFIELGIIVLQGIRKAGIKPGDHVAVVGQGLIGQLANRIARLLGTTSLIAVASSRNRERSARLSGGADEYVSLSDTPERVHTVRADVVIEAVGSPQAISVAMNCARDGGRVVLLGSSRGLTRDLDMWGLAQRRNLEIVGAHISDMPETDESHQRWTYEQEGRLFLDLLANGRLRVSDLVTWRARPDECNAVYEVLAEGGRNHVGITFNWKTEAVGS
jgi:threonine dehydrogenase-like Zn-dependent dehydrogenase